MRYWNWRYKYIETSFFQFYWPPCCYLSILLILLFQDEYRMKREGRNMLANQLRVTTARSDFNHQSVLDYTVQICYFILLIGDLKPEKVVMMANVWSWIIDIELIQNYIKALHETFYLLVHTFHFSYQAIEGNKPDLMKATKVYEEAKRNILSKGCERAEKIATHLVGYIYSTLCCTFFVQRTWGCYQCSVQLDEHCIDNQLGIALITTPWTLNKKNDTITPCRGETKVDLGNFCFTLLFRNTSHWLFVL